MGVWPGLVFVAALVLGAAVLVWFLWADAWPFGRPDPVTSRLQSSANTMKGHINRVEARLRLQLLATEMDRGRRSAALRPGFRLVEDELEEGPMGSSAGADAQLLASLEALLVELTDERVMARQRLQQIIQSLIPPGAPGRQG